MIIKKYENSITGEVISIIEDLTCDEFANPNLKLPEDLIGKRLAIMVIDESIYKAIPD